MNRAVDVAVVVVLLVIAGLLAVGIAGAVS